MIGYLKSFCTRRQFLGRALLRKPAALAFSCEVAVTGTGPKHQVPFMGLGGKAYASKPDVAHHRCLLIQIPKLSNHFLSRTMAATVV